jgi:Fic family protein
MSHSGYWLFEFISISDILLRAPAKYYRAFLYSETDDNDATYFVVHQAEVIRRAIQRLHAYIDKKSRESQESEKLLRAWEMLNHRQVAIITHALRHPGWIYTIEGHRESHNTAYDTARKDLLSLAEQGLMHMGKRSRMMIFTPAPDIYERIQAKGASPFRSPPPPLISPSTSQ